MKRSNITWYNPGIGSCGWPNGDWQLVAAVSNDMMGAPSNGNLNCARVTHVFYGGHEVDVFVVDKCGGCANQDIDLSPVAFQALGLDQGVGRYHGGT